MKLPFRLRSLIIKITHFEFWPWQYFYIPIYAYGIILAIRARSTMYFSTVNKGLKFGGAIGEGKGDILKKIDTKYLPKTIFFEAKTSSTEIKKVLTNHQFSYPIVAKPDIGERGNLVELIKNDDDLEHYLTINQEKFFIQEFISFPLELGILYYKFPNENHGHITSIVIKEFLIVTGDGKSTLLRLLENNIRARLRLKAHKEKFKERLEEVIPKGQELKLEPIGNHSRGTTFLNGNYLINDQLVTVFDNIAKSIEGYDYGRFDLKVTNVEDLYAGKNIKIMELNGLNSEPAHIYHPNFSLIKAYITMFKHMNIIYQIGKQKYKLGEERLEFTFFLRALIRHLS